MHHVHTYSRSRDVAERSPVSQNLGNVGSARYLHMGSTKQEWGVLMAITWLDWFKVQLWLSVAGKDAGTHEHCTRISPQVTMNSNFNGILNEKNMISIVLHSSEQQERKPTCSSSFSAVTCKQEPSESKCHDVIGKLPRCMCKNGLFLLVCQVTWKWVMQTSVSEAQQKLDPTGWPIL